MIKGSLASESLKTSITSIYSFLNGLTCNEYQCKLKNSVMASLFRFPFSFFLKLKLKQNPPYQSPDCKTLQNKIGHHPFSSGVETVGHLKVSLSLSRSSAGMKRAERFVVCLACLHSIKHSAFLITNDPSASR